MAAPLAPGTHAILVVDDDHEVCEAIAMYLEHVKGFEVFRATSPSAALKRLKAVGKRVRLLISDVIFSAKDDVANGIELAQVIKLKYPHIRILLTSGNLMITANPPHGCGFLGKPFTGEDLETAIANLFANGDAGDPA